MKIQYIDAYFFFLYNSNFFHQNFRISLHCKEVWRSIVDQHKSVWFSLKFKIFQNELKQKKTLSISIKKKNGDKIGWRVPKNVNASRSSYKPIISSQV